MVSAPSTGRRSAEHRTVPPRLPTSANDAFHSASPLSPSFQLRFVPSKCHFFFLLISLPSHSPPPPLPLPLPLPIPLPLPLPKHPLHHHKLWH
ncbi:hypothetical protein TcWFU_010519 [Taenia crassiceps]|uniref:Uncharacterized protein n=1 Tax=Taenia crassiceps TaxID=6207 RepID=A0ABR4QCA9_9CEST